MVFSSATFLFQFLPCFLLLYFVSPRCLKNYVLLLASLVFYFVGVQMQVFVMLGVILINYVAALLIDKARNRRILSRIILAVTLIVSFAVLFYFKYFNFVLGSLSSLIGHSWDALDILLPIGISFYLFQTVSYTIDVYRNEVAPRKNPLILATYVTMFPQLVAGPIVRYSDIETMLDSRKESFEKAAEGIRRFVIGLAKKVIFANTLAEMTKNIRELDERTVVMYWIWAISFTLTIYFDFSGYSDMAIGLGKILGFDFSENFNYPYESKSITEFFRRWHISLSSWFRDYVYIPLGGNRKGRVRQIFNLFVVWLCTGLWHGAAWNFVLWGLLYAVLLTLEKTVSPYITTIIPKVIKRIYTLFFVMIGFVLFDAVSSEDAKIRIGGIFGIGVDSIWGNETCYLVLNYGLIIIISALASVSVLKKAVTAISQTKYGRRIVLWTEPCFLLVLFVISLAFVVDSSFNPFIYFRF